MLTALTIATGAGYLASLTLLPLPWLLGSMFATAFWVIFLPGKLNRPENFPRRIRDPFVVVIAVMIGGAFSPEVLGSFGQWWPSLAGVILFAIAAHAMVFWMFRRIGGYDLPTAYFGASPGGFIESVLLGQEAGGDVRVMTLLQFLRIVLVVTIIPIAFAIWVGRPVGSAAGATFDAGATPHLLVDWLWLLGAGAGGYFFGRILKIPAGILVGPFLFSGLVHLFGLTQSQIPQWLVTISQIVIGATLGLRFTGIKRSDISKAFALSALSVSMMLILALTFGFVLNAFTSVDISVYVMSFSPGGVIETSLIALTLGANPIFVTAHHIVRIFFTVTVTPYIYRRFLR